MLNALVLKYLCRTPVITQQSVSGVVTLRKTQQLCSPAVASRHMCDDIVVAGRKGKKRLSVIKQGFYTLASAGRHKTAALIVA